MKKLNVILIQIIFSLSCFGQGYFLEYVPNNFTLTPAYTAKISKYSSRDEVLSIRVVKIANPFLKQSDGKLNFTSNNILLPNKVLRTLSANYKNAEKYKWR